MQNSFQFDEFFHNLKTVSFKIIELFSTLWAITQLGQRKVAHVKHLATAGAPSRLLQPVQKVAPKSMPVWGPVILSKRPVMP